MKIIFTHKNEFNEKKKKKSGLAWVHKNCKISYPRKLPLERKSNNIYMNFVYIYIYAKREKEIDRERQFKFSFKGNKRKFKQQINPRKM